MKLSGIERAYDDVGSGPAIVLLHGFPFDRSMWREQLEFLSANGFRAIAPDLRGLGEMSDKLQFVAEANPNETERQAEARRTTTTMEDMARDVAALMDDLEIDRAAVCGLSMGSYVAFEFLRHFPSRVRALVLAGARAQPADEAEKESREQQAQRVLDQGLGFAVDSIFTNLLAKPTLSEKAGVVSRVREMILRTDPRGAAAAQRGMAARGDYSRDLAGITVPTLIIAGREDAVRRPDDAEFIHHGVRNSRLEIIDEAGHLMNMEQPEIFNKALIGFLEACADTAGASPPS
jgi:pimeloyl-ACP methyl ester carboxylesterase